LILLVAVVVGLLAGVARSQYYSRPFVVPELRLVWLAAVAFLPQWLAFFFAATRGLFTEQTASAALVTSQICLLGFGWANRRHAGFSLLIVGLLLNLAVIISNGGLMPISPETLQRLMPTRSTDSWVVGQRLGTSKDRILREADTNLAWLSDRFVLPDWLPYKVAYSVGDIFIAVGAYWFLWSAGGARQQDSGMNPKESVRV
jgi:hypothetical protein